MLVNHFGSGRWSKSEESRRKGGVALDVIEAEFHAAMIRVIHYEAPDIELRIDFDQHITVVL